MSEIGYDGGAYTGEAKIYIDRGDFIYKIYDCIKAYGEEITYDVLAVVTYYLFGQKMYELDKYLDDIPATKPRSMVFSDECLAEEIKLHANAFMSSIGLDVDMPKRFSLYSYFGANAITKWKRNDYIKRACQVINITESDVTDTTQDIGFMYQFGIRECYKNTKADPFYSTSLKARVKAFPKNTEWSRYLYEYTD